MTAPVTVEPQSEKIAMTAPVTVSAANPESVMTNSNKWRVHFVMPSQYTLANIPQPKNAEVKLREIPGKFLRSAVTPDSTRNLKFKPKQMSFLLGLSVKS